MMKKQGGIGCNVYAAMLWRLLAVMLLFQLCRLGFYLFNTGSFPATTPLFLLKAMAGGTVFDLTAVLYTNSLYIVMQMLPFRFRERRGYQLASKWVFAVTNSVALLANVADFIYFRFTLRRTTAMVFQEFAGEQNGAALFFQFLIDYWYAALFFAGAVALLIWLYNRVRVVPSRIVSPWVYYPLSLLLFGVAVGLFIGGVRGGFAHSTRPITISNATEYITHPGEEFIVLNTPFSIYRTLGAVQLERRSDFPEEELEAVYSPVHRPAVGADSAGFRKKNVVIFIIESFGAEYIGAYNQDKQIEGFKSYTPFLDSLAGESLVFLNARANGKKSIEGIPSVLASTPSYTFSFVLSPYTHNHLTSLSGLLNEEGYETAFFHGAPNGSMGFLAFTRKLGIENYFGKTEYEARYPDRNDFDGIWGIWDDKFLPYFAETMGTLRQPFMTALFTLSSHHPFKVPAEFEGKFDKGHVQMHQVVGYTDYALRRFFEEAKKSDWYENTLFVITADHTNQSYYKEYNTYAGHTAVPIIFFSPEGDLKGVREEVAQQIDIFPSVLGYLGYDKPYFAFGTDLFSQDGRSGEHIAVNYLNNLYVVYYRHYLLTFDGKETQALYDTAADPMLTDDRKDAPGMQEVRRRIERKIKAFLQQYDNRMIDDRLVYQPD